MKYVVHFPGVRKPNHYRSDHSQPTQVELTLVTEGDATVLDYGDAVKVLAAIGGRMEPAPGEAYESSVLGVEWRACGLGVIGVVAVSLHDGWTARMGIIKGQDEHADMLHVREWGHWLSAAEAAPYFPHLNIGAYK